MKHWLEYENGIEIGIFHVKDLGQPRVHLVLGFKCSMINFVLGHGWPMVIFYGGLGLRPPCSDPIPFCPYPWVT